MEERKMLAILVIVQAVQCVTAMFYHEPSNVIIQSGEAEVGSDFGFAMAYRNETKTLVVGAPKADFIGKIFNCELEDADVKENISCTEQNIEISSSEYSLEKFPKQHFHLGSTIVASDDYFFTCAPLWTTNTTITAFGGRNVEVTDAFGTCFIQNDLDDTVRYQGLLENYLKSKKKGLKLKPHRNKLSRFTGGTGWSTLIDPHNDLLLIAKTSLAGDFFSLPVSKPYTNVKALADYKPYKQNLDDYWNIGFGLTSGKFFSKTETVYAFSMLQKRMQGVISFLEYNKQYDWLGLMMRNSTVAAPHRYMELSSNAVGTMFGTTMSAADLNLDGLDELLVGAPTQSEDDCFDCGAIHIYSGGDMITINDQKRLRSIYANAHFGRFGTAIVAKDIDGDGKPELVVSAPYEDHGRGAIYILSGYELYNTLIKTEGYKSVQLSDLKLTQRIQKESYRTLGFSLQFIDDIDENGCQELAASSTGSSKVLLFKCVQKINVTLSTQLIGDQPSTSSLIVREQDTSFTVQVCARVQIPKLPKDIIGNITIENSIDGEAAIVQQPNIVIDMSCDNCLRDRRDLCANVTVKLADVEPGDYTFKSKAQIQNNFLSDRYMEEFNNTWVEASPYSKLDTTMEVARHCTGNDCIPDLSPEILWSGGDSYILGSTANETVTIKVRNHGNASYLACIWLRVIGPPLSRVDCESYNNGYRCYLPKPLKRDAEYSINVMLNMTRPKNVGLLNLRVTTDLYPNCNQETIKTRTKFNKTLYLTSERVFNDGETHKLNITDKQILDNATIYDHHEYQIRNNGSITWEKVEFSVEMEKKPYINSFDISATDYANCIKNNLTNSNFIIHHCTMNLLPNTTLAIIGNLEILAGRLKRYAKGGELNISSTSKFYLSDKLPMLSATSLTTITFQKEISLAGNKWLIIMIAVVVALILLAILTLVLYKCGFFRRKQKQSLLVLKESVRRKSIRRDTHASATDGPVEGLQMDVVDDCPFEDARPVTTKDNVGLVDDEEP